MRMMTRAALVAAIGFAFAGPAQARAQAQAPQEANAAIVTKSGPLASPAAGQGLVVFYRPGSLMGAALGCTVHEGQAEVARLGSGKFYAIPATPGPHQYNTQAETTDRINLEVEAGETYFVRCKLGFGVMAGRPNLSPSTRAEFAAKAKGLTMWKGPKD